VVDGVVEVYVTVSESAGAFRLTVDTPRAVICRRSAPTGNCDAYDVRWTLVNDTGADWVEGDTVFLMPKGDVSQNTRSYLPRGNGLTLTPGRPKGTSGEVTVRPNSDLTWSYQASFVRHGAVVALLDPDIVIKKG
jgi:hypothetical protein